jgi:hypothetical protein
VVAQTRAGERGGLTKAEAQETDDPDIVTSPHEMVLRPGLVTETGTGGGDVVARRLGTRLALVSQPVTQEAFPAGEMTAFAADSPYARCMRGREPVIPNAASSMASWTGTAPLCCGNAPG